MRAFSVSRLPLLLLVCVSLSIQAQLPSQSLLPVQNYWDCIESLYTSASSQKDLQAASQAYVLSIMKPDLTTDSEQIQYLLPLMKDLRIIHGTDHHTEVHLLGKIDRTSTLFGRAALCYQLANPITNTRVLQQRQAIIQTFLQDSHLLAECQKWLRDIEENQHYLIDFLRSDASKIADRESLYMSTMNIWQTYDNDRMPKRILKKIYSTFAAANNFIARKINNSEIPYVGSYPLESLMWWRKFWAFWPLGLQIGLTSVGHAYQEPTMLAMDKAYNQDLAMTSQTYDQVKIMNADQFNTWRQQHIPPLPEIDQKLFLQHLSQSRQELMHITKVGIENNNHLALVPELVTFQAQKNAEQAHQKLISLPSFSRRVINAAGMMTNLLFNPAHPSNMKLFGWPVKPSEYYTWYGYSVKLINLLTIFATNIATVTYIKKTVDDQVDIINKIRLHVRAASIIENARQCLYKRLAEAGIAHLLVNHDALSGHTASPTYVQTLKSLPRTKLDQSFGVGTFGAGKILTAHKNLSDIKEELYTVMRALGEIDLYVSLAQLYKEHESGDARYVFADFNPETYACLELTDVWNPFIDVQNVVPNTLFIGKNNGYNHMLLTGSNTGGKSTFLRAVALATLMAQTIGIVPARTARLTPFSDIVVLLNVSDDPTNKESTFSAEGSRARELLHRVHTLEPDQRALILIDELFKGTSHQEGLKWACAVTHYLARSSNAIITLFATHFHELTQLERSTQGCFKNYHLDAQRIPTRDGKSGSYTCSYHLQEGPCTVNIASDIMHQKLEGFDLGDVEGDLQQLLTQTQKSGPAQ